VFADAGGIVDAWYAAWTVTGDQARDEAFEKIATEDVSFRDRYSLLEGRADLSSHAGASQRFMPGIALYRKGEARHCQGTVITDWIATQADGQVRMSGTSVLVLGPDRRIKSATSFTNPTAR
jgi:hypothetical protein